MNITNVLVWPTTNNTKIAANGMVTFDEAVQVKFVLLKGKDTLFVGFPGKYGDKLNKETGEKEKTWFADVNVKSKQLKEQINTAVVKAYQEKTGGSSLDQGSPPAAEDQSLPF